MNTQNFNQLGGFPLETDTLNWMQEAYNIFNKLGEVVGNYTIISGCVVSGSNVGDGVVYANGEIFAFKGGVAQATVRILETKTQKEFENGDVKDVHTERYITFASGAGAINWSEFKRPDTLKSISSRILPAGTNPQLYSGDVNNIPEGWQLCDGTNGTPDLRSRFIVGYNESDSKYNTIGNTGGSKDAVVVAHTHSINDPGHFHTISGDAGGEGYATLNDGAGPGVNTNTKTTGITINSSGESGTDKNLPPYYVLAYIIYTG